jgi:hypothetical protein
MTFFLKIIPFAAACMRLYMANTCASLDAMPWFIIVATLFTLVVSFHFG